MKNIEIEVLNPEAVKESERMAVCAARLTQRGPEIKTINDFLALYQTPYNDKTVASLAALPHPTLQKLDAINIVIVGASRRFLAQVTRHQNEVKFISASLQYCDYSGSTGFAIPYSVLAKGDEERGLYLATCEREMLEYEMAITRSLDHDSAGYLTPQALRNVLIVSATPYQWKHMISQRTCRRNTDETRIVFLKIWRRLYELSPALFSVETTGPFCHGDGCKEGKMSCQRPYTMTPDAALHADYPILFEDDTDEA